MRLKNKLYKKYRRHPTKDAWEHYRTQRNILTKLKRVAIKRFCADSASNASTPNSFWKNLKPLLPSARREVSQDDIHLIDDGKVIKEPSNFFNSFFSTPVLDQPALKLKREEFSTHPSISSISSRDFKLNFSFQPARVSYIQSVLDRIKCNKSCGPDNIMPKILKYSAPSIAVHLTRLLNLYISTSTWPTEWKLSHVTPVFKKDDATLVSNYRPISVLSIIPKILEKVNFDQLYDVFKPLFSSNMSGFLRGHSCYTALIKMFDDWRLAPLQSTYLKPLIPYVITCFLQSYVLMVLVRRRLTSCIPTCLVASKEWRSTEFSRIGYRCTVAFLKVAFWGHSYLTYLSTMMIPLPMRLIQIFLHGNCLLTAS